MKKPVKILLGCVSVAALALCVLCVLFIVQYVRGQSLSDRLGGGLTSAMQIGRASCRERVCQYV